MSILETNQIGEYSFSCYQSTQSISKLEHEWNELHNNCSFKTFYNSFDFIFSAISAFNTDDYNAFFIVVRNLDDNETVALFPFNLSKYSWKRGSFKALIYAGHTESDKTYPVIKSGMEEKIWPMLLRFIKSKKKQWDFFDLAEVKKGLYVGEIFEASFSNGYLTRRNDDVASPIIDLTQNWEKFWEKHKKMRKRVRKVEKIFGDNFRFEVTSNPDKGLVRLNEYIDLEAKSWKASAKVGVGKSAKTREFYQQLFSLLSKQKQLYFGFLYDGENLVSAEIAYTLGETVYFSHGCYNSEYKDLSPGMVSTCLFLKHFFNKGYTEGDFLGGFAQYINPWASHLLSSENLIVIKLGPKVATYYLLDLLRKYLYRPVKKRVVKLISKIKAKSVKVNDTAN